MFGAFSFLSDFFDILKAFFIYGALGAATGLIAAGVSRFIHGVSGLVAAMVLGAAVVIGANASGYLGARQDCNTQAHIRMLNSKIEELRATSAALNKTLKEEAAAAEHNADVVASLKARLADMEDKPECDIPKDVIDDLNNIR